MFLLMQHFVLGKEFCKQDFFRIEKWLKILFEILRDLGKFVHILSPKKSMHVIKLYSFVVLQISSNTDEHFYRYYFNMKVITIPVFYKGITIKPAFQTVQTILQAGVCSIQQSQWVFSVCVCFKPSHFTVWVDAHPVYLMPGPCYCCSNSSNYFFLHKL